MNIKDDFKLIFNSKSITIPEELTDEEKHKYIIKLYKRKKELHEKIGALGFREIVLKLERLDLFGKVIEQNSQNMISLIQEYKSGDDNDIYINSTYRCNSRYAYNYNF